MNKRGIVFAILIMLSACNSNHHDTQNDTLSVTLTLNHLPEFFEYNKSTTLDGRIEYEWGVTFDISGDGAINEGDIVLRVLHYKQPDSEPKTGPISDFDANLWIYETDTQTVNTAEAAVQISGTSITISIDKNAHSSLMEISETTLVYFKTFALDDMMGELPQTDYHPSFATYMSMPADMQFTDTKNDASPDFIDLINMHISL